MTGADLATQGYTILPLAPTTVHHHVRGSAPVRAGTTRTTWCYRLLQVRPRHQALSMPCCQACLKRQGHLACPDGPEAGL